jgi:hypothetical protein
MDLNVKYKNFRKKAIEDEKTGICGQAILTLTSKV